MHVNASGFGGSSFRR